MKVVVGGATGLIGRALCTALVERGDEVVALARRPGEVAGLPTCSWDPDQGSVDASMVLGAHAFVNLAGTGIADGRWGEGHRRAILQSRLTSTRLLGSLAHDSPGSTFLSGSAIGYYGTGEDEYSEASAVGTDFLADICARWEAAAMGSAGAARVVLLRSGLVLSPHGGALAPQRRLFMFGLGGPLGTGRQWQSWIHLDDEVGLILRALDDPSVIGPMNLVAPHPVRQSEFAAALGRALHRPARLRTPAVALRMVLGGASELALLGQRVTSTVARRLGYEFRYPNLDGALADLLSTT
jgi:uncharacterized protein (TIGR01777 family)